VGPDVVVVIAPQGQFSAGVIQCIEEFLVQELVAQAAIERLDEGILLGLAWVDVMPIDVIVVRPFEDGPTGGECPVFCVCLIRSMLHRKEA